MRTAAAGGGGGFLVGGRSRPAGRQAPPASCRGGAFRRPPQSCGDVDLGERDASFFFFGRRR